MVAAGDHIPDLQWRFIRFTLLNLALSLITPSPAMPTSTPFIPVQVDTPVVSFSPLPALDAAVEKVRKGDVGAYRTIVEETQRAVRVTVAMIVPNPVVIDDLSQEVFIRVFDRLGDYEVGTNFLAWIKAFARNAALNERKRYFLRQRRESDLVEDVIEDPTPGIRQREQEEESVARLHQAVNELPPVQRELISRFYFDREASKSIAKDLGLSDGAVRVQLHRARARLASLLSRDPAA